VICPRPVVLKPRWSLSFSSTKMVGCFFSISSALLCRLSCTSRRRRKAGRRFATAEPALGRAADGGCSATKRGIQRTGRDTTRGQSRSNAKGFV
jgi:hypothetical protein